MKYDLIIEQSLKSTALKRIRVKVDPKLVSQENDLSKCDGYEGYILAEHEGGCKILVMSPDELMTMNVPIGHLEEITDDRDELLKSFIMYILGVFRVSVDSPLALQLFTANSIEMIESALKQNGYTDDEVKILYRDFIVKENAELVSEISLGGILKAAGKVAAGVGKVYSAAGLQSGQGLQNIGNWAAAKGQGMIDKKEADILKKLDRPEGDPKVDSVMEFNLPFLNEVPFKRRITKVQKIPNGALYTVNIFDPQAEADLERAMRLGLLQPRSKFTSNSLQVGNEKISVDEVKITDVSGSYSKITYFEKGKVVKPKEGWATSVGLHYNDQKGLWEVDTSLQPAVSNLQRLKTFLITYKKDQDFQPNENLIKLINGSKSLSEIEAAVIKNGIKKDVLDNIIGKFYGDISVQSQADEELHESRVLSVMAKYQPIF